MNSLHNSADIRFSSATIKPLVLIGNGGLYYEVCLLFSFLCREGKQYAQGYAQEGGKEHALLGRK